jgi:hypothetical protein
LARKHARLISPVPPPIRHDGYGRIGIADQLQRPAAEARPARCVKGLAFKETVNPT